MPRVLIVAYGNPLRGDDALAWRAADELERKFSGSDVELLCLHQLAPELAETVSRSEAVIFVDAASADAGGNQQPGEVRCEEISLQTSKAQSGPTRFSHQFSPAIVVALAHQLYRSNPHAFSVTLTGQCFDPGESLSPVVAESLPALVARIEALVQQFLSPQRLREA